MKFSFNFLSKFIDLNSFINNLDELSNKLSLAGFEVEGWEPLKLPGVVIAEVKQKIKHPSADRLSLCKVLSQENKIHNIVCGASNFKIGDKVVLALPGAKLPKNFIIKTRTVRGEISEGMLSSLSELGLDFTKQDSEGILILPSTAKVGDDFDSYIGLKDVIFDINITPNRADCLSHFGLSRELSCILNQDLKSDFLNTDFLEATLKKALGPSIKNTLDITVNQKSLCLNYTGRAIYGVTVKPSPLWLKVLFQNLGLKSINNIVDITNYFLIKWGQPLHAFDLDTLSQKLIIDFSQKKELFKTLDHQEITLTGTELCIKNAKKTLALAGVIGGLDSGIKQNTKNIFVESACFNPDHIRKISKKFNIETDASIRFSRGVPADITLKMLHKAVCLIQQIAGGVISKDEHSIKNTVSKIKTIDIKTTYVSSRLGYNVTDSEFTDVLKRLKGKVDIHNNIIKVMPPFFRFDLNNREDLIEEYARLNGYNKIPEKLSYLSIPPMSDCEQYTLSSRIKTLISREGFYQAINHSFISQKFSDSFFNSLTPPLCENKNLSPVLVKNPLSAEYDMMRVSLLPSLFKNAQLSIRYGCLLGRLFEVGKVFISKTQDNQKDIQKDNKSPYKETPYLAFIAWGQEENLWAKNKNRLCVYDLKTAIQSLLNSFCIQDYEWVLENEPPCFMHPYQYSVLKVQNKKVGYVGSLNPFYAEQYKTRVNLALAEINLQFIINSKKIKAEFKNLSSFPLVTRDLSFLIPKELPVEEIIKGIKKQAGSVCTNIDIFDVYENKQLLAEGVRAVAFRLTLQSNTKTLTEDNLKKIQQQITQEMVSKYPVKLR